MGCPRVEGFADETTVGLVLALVTICAIGLDELDATFPSPLYTAVMECVPTDNELSVRLAEFPATFIVPSEVTPSRKVTVPVAGTPYCGVIVAAKVTDWR